MLYSDSFKLIRFETLKYGSLWHRIVKTKYKTQNLLEKSQTKHILIKQAHQNQQKQLLQAYKDDCQSYENETENILKSEKELTEKIKAENKSLKKQLDISETNIKQIQVFEYIIN